MEAADGGFRACVAITRGRRACGGSDAQAATLMQLIVPGLKTLGSGAECCGATSVPAVESPSQTGAVAPVVQGWIVAAVGAKNIPNTTPALLGKIDFHCVVASARQWLHWLVAMAQVGSGARSLGSDAAGRDVATGEVTYSCRRCRTPLCTSSDLAAHDVSSQTFSYRRRLKETKGAEIVGQSAGKPDESRCDLFVPEPLEWMGLVEGRLACPNKQCGARVGNLKWAGIQCSCPCLSKCCRCCVHHVVCLTFVPTGGSWVTPGCQILKSRVDARSKAATAAVATTVPTAAPLPGSPGTEAAGTLGNESHQVDVVAATGAGAAGAGAGAGVGAGGDAGGDTDSGEAATTVAASGRLQLARAPATVHQTDFTAGSGNALQACVASLFALPLDTVPNFIELAEGYAEGIKAFVAGSFVPRKVAVGATPDGSGTAPAAGGDSVHGSLPLPASDAARLCLLRGTSPRGSFGHVVVARVTQCAPPVFEYVCDPHPDGTFLSESLPQNSWAMFFDRE